MKHPERYCEAVEGRSQLSCETEVLDEDNLRAERIMLGLRLGEGIETDDLDEGALDRLRRKGWVTTNGRVRLTDLGTHYCNQVVLELL
jgi:coproporphyrinogen III oxidase-like Fe-S oxidoreductase